YRAIVNDMIKVVRDNFDLIPIPEEVTWPAPQTTKTGDATLYYYSFPDELQLDGRPTPTAPVGKNVATLTVSNEHAQRLLAPRPLQPPAVASTWQPGSSMLRRSYSPAYGYLLAAVATAIIALARFGGSDMLDSHSRYMPFILAVMVAAWYGGLMPGLFATFLA